MDRELIKKAFWRSVPVSVGYIIIGIGFGIVLQDAGYGLGWALAMSLFIYAGSMQYVGVSLIAAPACLLTAFLTTLTVNARHIFYSLSMLKKYGDTGAYKPYLIFALTDETYALLVEEPEEDRERHRQFCLFVSLFNHIYWVLGTAIGSIFAAALPFDTNGISFSMTALFVASFTEQWLSGRSRLSGLIGLLVTVVCRLLFGRDLFLIPSMVLITLLLLMLRPRLEKGENGHD